MGDPETNSLYGSEQITSFALGPDFLILKMQLHSNNCYGLSPTLDILLWGINKAFLGPTKSTVNRLKSENST